MKMVSIIDAVFWGVVLIALGAWLILRRYVPVQIPFGRLIVALVLIYLGIRVLAGGPWVAGGTSANTTVFSESTVKGAPGEKDYNVIFGTSVIDLTGLPPAETTREVNVVFGNATVRVDASAPVRIRMSAAFGSVEAPNGTSVVFGDRSWTSEAFKEGAPALLLKANAVFGRLVIQEQPGE